MNFQSKVLLGVLATLVWALPASAEIRRTQTTTATEYSIEENAPLYTGTVAETSLEELTLADFQNIAGTKPSAAAAQYQQYKLAGRNPDSTKPRLYKIRVADTDTSSNFGEYNVRPGETAYVYVYHRPVTTTTTTTTI